MSVRVYNSPIPRNKIGQFDEILKATGGRYISNPRFVECENVFRIDYVPGPTTDSKWERMNCDIRETRSPAWKRFFRRLSMVGRKL